MTDNQANMATKVSSDMSDLLSFINALQALLMECRHILTIICSKKIKKIIPAFKPFVFNYLRSPDFINVCVVATFDGCFRPISRPFPDRFSHFFPPSRNDRYLYNVGACARVSTNLPACKAKNSTFLKKLQNNPIFCLEQG